VKTALDHLVVIATSLDEGVAWCEQTLGVSPGPGGQHPLMGTHNRLLRIGGPGFERAYLEILAIEPGVQPQRPAPLKRWFDFDDAALAQRMSDRALKVISATEAGELLVRAYQDPTHFECRMCAWQDRCWRQNNDGR